MTNDELKQRWAALMVKIGPLAAGFIEHAWGEMQQHGGSRHHEHVLLMLEIAVLAGQAYQGAEPIREIGERVKALAAEIETQRQP